MLWLLIIILAYFFFALTSFGDKVVLDGPARPKLYTFYVGLLNFLIIALIPFIEFNVPKVDVFLWIILEAIVYVMGMYTMFVVIEKFEVSRVIPAIGAIQPLLILILTGLFFGAAIFNGKNLLAFFILLLGSIIISTKEKFKINIKYLLLLFFSALMFSLDYIFSKFVFLRQPFLTGFIWMRIFSFLFVMLFLFDRQLRKQLFTKEHNLNKKTGAIFLLTQSSGALATILQSFAISLAPVAYLATVNSLRGIQYVFIFIITLFVSYFFPRIEKEDISKKVIIQKVIAIALIIIGLIILIAN